MSTVETVAREWVGDGRDGTVPGLVALVAHGDDVHVTTAGTLALGGAPVRRDSLFRIASTTKPLVAALVLALVDDGLLGLDEPVGRLLPELAEPRVLRRPDGPLDDTVAATRPITVRHLLTYTAGVGQEIAMFTAPRPWPVVAAANDRALNTYGPPDPATTPEPDTWLARLGELPLVAQPGERWLYHTSGQVLGVLAARAAGAPLPEVLRDRILDPLGMHDTAFWTAETDRLATAYASAPEGLRVWDRPEGAWSGPHAFPDGAGGLVSTADDLLAFARMLSRGGDGVLSAGAVHGMTHDQLSDEQKASDGAVFLDDGARTWAFGQSVIRTGERAGAFGWDGGLGTTFLVHPGADPARDLAVVVLTQRLFDSPVLPAVHAALQGVAYAAAGPAGATPGRAPSPAAGRV